MTQNVAITKVLKIGDAPAELQLMPGIKNDGFFPVVLAAPAWCGARPSAVPLHALIEFILSFADIIC